jgi:hypothetical protein
MAQLSEHSITIMDRTLDDLYSVNPTVTRGRIVEAATIAGVGDDVMFYVTELPDGAYTRREVDQTLNDMIDRYGDLGHLR